jgi:transaldolase
MTRLERLRAAGVSIWLDTLSRGLLESGRYERHVRQHGVTGVTANPTIIERALADSSAYDEQLRRLAAQRKSAKAAFFELALEDVRRATGLLRPAHRDSGGHDGFVSFEATPDLAHDPAGTFDGIASVASFFVSRIDAKADPLLPAGSPLRGRIAIANAQRAFARQRELFAGERWARLSAAGAREQRPLWASTGTKDPDLSDVHYVERLIAPETINTMPEKTLLAFADHGEVRAPIDLASESPQQVLAAAAVAGIELDDITAELEREGVRSFSDSYERLLERLGSELAAAPPARPSSRTSRARRLRVASTTSR